MSFSVRGPAYSGAGLRASEAAFERGISRLSSGLRIQRAADDAAGLAISERMRAQISGSAMAIRNVHDAINLAQTAEGGLDVMTSLLQRARELAVQSASTGTATQADRDVLANEVQHLVDEIDRVAVSTQFNQHRLLDGSRPTGWIIQVGAGAGETLTIELPDRDATALGLRGGSGSTTSLSTTTYETTSASITSDYSTSTSNNTFTFSIAGGEQKTVQLDTGKKYETGSLAVLQTDLQNALTSAGIAVTVGLSGKKLTFSAGDPSVRVDVTGNGASHLKITTKETTTTTLTTFATGDLVELVRAGSGDAIAVADAALRRVMDTRTYLGATQNRLEHRLGVLAAAQHNLGDARSRIADADVAKEWAGVVRAQLLSQAGVAMQSQASAGGQRVLQLLGAR